MFDDTQAIILLECENEDCYTQTKIEIFVADKKLLSTKCLICGGETYVLRAWYKNCDKK